MVVLVVLGCLQPLNPADLCLSEARHSPMTGEGTAILLEIYVSSMLSPNHSSSRIYITYTGNKDTRLKMMPLLPAF